MKTLSNHSCDVFTGQPFIHMILGFKILVQNLKVFVLQKHLVLKHLKHMFEMLVSMITNQLQSLGKTDNKIVPIRLLGFMFM